MSLRLVADYVVPGEGRGELIANGAVDINAEGRIEAIGPLAELGDPAGDVINTGGLLMPGLVNAHAHTPMTLVRSAGDGMALQQWLTEGVWPREGRMDDEDAWWGMTLGSAEMLEGGVTTSVEMYLFEDAVVDAVRRSGARVMCAPGIISALARNGDLSSRLDRIASFLAENHESNGRIRVGYGPHSAYDLSPEVLREIGERAAADDALVHIHLEETEAERNDVLAKHGKSATALLHDLGLLECHVLAAHGVWLDDADRRVLAEAGAAVAHCPESNLKLGSGMADALAMLDAGLLVGVGTDGPASNDDLDMWSEMRTAGLLARGLHCDPQAMSAATVLSLATKGAAAAIGFDDIGELRPGYWADIVRVDLDRPAFAPGRQEELLAHLVWAGSPAYVTDVWVAGDQVVDGGHAIYIDRTEALAQARERGIRLSHPT